MAYGRDERHWFDIDNFVLRGDLNGDVDVGVERGDVDVDVGVGVEGGPIDDVMDAGVGRDRADEKLPLEHSAIVGFFRSMVGLRDEAAGQRASWLLSSH